jgi:hypothetical protein
MNSDGPQIPRSGKQKPRRMMGRLQQLDRVARPWLTLGLRARRCQPFTQVERYNLAKGFIS